MSRHKLLRGSFSFAQTQSGSSDDVAAQFDLIYKALTVKFEARALVGFVAPAPEQDQSLPKGQAKGTNGSKPAARETRLPFPVVLSFLERPGENLFSRIKAAFFALGKCLLTAAETMPGGIGEGATALAVLEHFIQEHPDASQLQDAKIAASGLEDVDKQRLTTFVDRWTQENPQLQQFKDAIPDQWRQLIGKVLGHDPGPVAPAAPAALTAGTPAAAATPPTDVPAPYASAPAADEQIPDAPFTLTQLMGWLEKSGNGKDDGYRFSAEGRTRNEDDAVQYGSWGRLDVLGPDGSQLLTYFADQKELANWLFGSGESDIAVEIPATTELRAALTAQARETIKPTKVRGRLWFSNGRPFGVRTVAIYAPPALPCVKNGCTVPFDIEECCDEQPNILVAPEALAVVETDDSGYFEFSYDEAKAHLKDGYSLLKISGVTTPVAVELKPGSREHQKRFPDPILLEVDASLLAPMSPDVNWLDEDSSDCDCSSTNLDQSNRAIDEFKTDIVVRTTDPMVVRLPINDSELQTARIQEADAILPDESAINHYARVALSRTNQISWDEDNPVLAQAVTISHGRVLTISQTWHPDGYSLGDLCYSLPLAPLQKKNIAIIDWDRRDRSALDSSEEYREAFSNYTDRARDISEIATSAMRETMTSHSDSGSSSQSAGIGGGLSFLFGSASGGSASASSNASQANGRDLSSNFINNLRDQTVQSANALRAQRVTMVQQVDQSESAKAVTETVANRNACHAITVQYFEVLRHFRIEHELVGVRECLYVPLRISGFDADKVLRNAVALETYLPTPELRADLAACQRLHLDDLGDGLVKPANGGGTPPVVRRDPSSTYADEAVSVVSGSLELTIDLPMPSATLDNTTDWKVWLGVTLPTPSPLPSMIDKLRQLPDDQRTTFWEQNIAPVLARKIAASLSVAANGAAVVRPALVSSYSAGERHEVVLRDNGALAAAGLKRRDLNQLRVQAIQLPDNFTVVVIGAALTLASDLQAVSLSTGPDGDGSLANHATVELPIPLLPSELRSPVLDDELAQRRLLEHLNGNVEFYHKAIWWTMDPDRRFALLDGFVAPNASGRSVASVVENRLIGIVGNSIVLPVAPGIRLDYFTDSTRAEQQSDDEDALLAYYRPTINPPATRIAIPTKGVFAEAVMGKCNACEKIDNSRNWQYWAHPLPDQPAPADLSSLGSRSEETPIAAPPPMPPSTFINQVTATLPPAPDPAGLGPIVAAITKPGIFPDGTGLAGTQQSAREALASSYATTTRFGELGAELSKKQLDAAISVMKALITYSTGVPMPGGNGGSETEPSSVKEDIKRDAASGRISKQEAQDSISKLNDAMIDRATKPQTANFLDHPQVAGAIGAASERGSSIALSHGDSRLVVGDGPPAPRRSSRRKDSFWGRLFGPSEAEATELPNRTEARSKTERVAKAKELLEAGGVYPKGCSEFVCQVLGIPFELANDIMGRQDLPVGKGPDYPKLEAGDIAGWINEAGSGHVSIYVGESPDWAFIDVREPGARPRHKNGFYDRALYKSVNF